MQGMTPRQTKFVNTLASGTTKRHAAIVAGYPPEYASITANRLLKNTNIIAALDAKGLNDMFIASKLKRNIQRGSKLDVTPEVYMRSLDLVTRLKGYQSNDTTNVTQNNVLIELKQLDDTALNERLDGLMSEIKQLQSTT